MGTRYSINVLGDKRVDQALIDKRLIEINGIFRPGKRIQNYLNLIKAL